MEKTNSLNQIQINNLLHKMSVLGYNMHAQIGTLHIVGLRNTNNVKDRFDDFICFLYMTKQGWEIYQYEATTDPGKHYLLNPIHKKGTGVVLHDILFKEVYQLQNPGHRDYEALRQVGAMKYVRDADKDAIIDWEIMLDQENIQEGVTGANLHRAGNTLQQFIGLYSAMCQVIRKKEDFLEAIELVKKSRQYIENKLHKFDYAIILWNQ